MCRGRFGREQRYDLHHVRSCLLRRNNDLPQWCSLVQKSLQERGRPMDKRQILNDAILRHSCEACRARREETLRKEACSALAQG